MKVAAIAITLFVSLASAGVVITPIKPDQIVAKTSGDCPLGEVTPQGCGPARRS